MENPWEEIDTPKHDLFYRRVDAEHPLRLLRARDTYGRFLFIYEFPPSGKVPDNHLPKLNGIELHVRETDGEGGGNGMLLLLLKDKKDWQIFHSLCSDLVASTRELKSDVQATQIILRRLKRWQEFLQQSRSGLLSEMEIKGLIGELLFLGRHLAPAFGVEASVQFWEGPNDSPQDFNVHDCAVEVKCQLGTTAPQVHISSADQLCSQLPEMFLCVVTLGKSEAGNPESVSIPSLVNEIRANLEVESPSGLQIFNDLLYLTGYRDLVEYEGYNYLPVSEKMYRVAPGFPRICSEQLEPGIERVSYNIKLADCESFAGTPDWMELS